MEAEQKSANVKDILVNSEANISGQKLKLSQLKASNKVTEQELQTSKTQVAQVSIALHKMADKVNELEDTHCKPREKVAELK